MASQRPTTPSEKGRKDRSCNEKGPSRGLGNESHSDIIDYNVSRATGIPRELKRLDVRIVARTNSRKPERDKGCVGSSQSGSSLVLRDDGEKVRLIELHSKCGQRVGARNGHQETERPIVCVSKRAPIIGDSKFAGKNTAKSLRRDARQISGGLRDASFVREKNREVVAAQ